MTKKKINERGGMVSLLEWRSAMAGNHSKKKRGAKGREKIMTEKKNLNRVLGTLVCEFVS